MAWGRSLKELEAIANTPSRERRRAEAMGFKFGHCQVVVDPSAFGYRIGGRFTCACGNEEFYNIVIDKLLVEADMRVLEQAIDPARNLRALGSFGRKHLLADGYTPEQVDEMMAKADAFDRDH